MRDIDQQNCKFTLMKAGYFLWGQWIDFFPEQKIAGNIDPLIDSLIWSSGPVKGQSRVRLLLLACDSDANIGCDGNWNVKLKVTDSENEI